jgi:hypothetical protein
MYAIKILNNSEVILYLADIIYYKSVNYKNKNEFWKQVKEIKPDCQIGEIPTEDSEGNYVDLELQINSDNALVNRLFIMPCSIIYIMQDGKTIEIVKID